MDKNVKERMLMIWKIVGSVKFFLDKCKRDNISAFAAQSAFFIILSSIPFLMVFSSLLKYTPVSEAMVLHLVKTNMPDYIAPFITSIINEVYNKSVGIVSLTAILAIWSAAKGVQYMANGLNVINDIIESRNWIILRLWAVGYTVVFVLAIITSMVLLVFGKSLRHFVMQYVPFLENLTNDVFGMRSLIMLVMLSFFFAIAFKTLPNRRVSFRSQLPGAILCSVAWYAFSFGLSIYVSYFNGFSMYGSLTTIVLIMLWLYFCMYIMMMCAEINVIFEDAFEKWLSSRKKREKKVDV
jgi:membrane protein